VIVWQSDGGAQIPFDKNNKKMVFLLFGYLVI
jgi:hypothetical protein